MAGKKHRKQPGGGGGGSKVPTDAPQSFLPRHFGMLALAVVAQGLLTAHYFSKKADPPPPVEPPPVDASLPPARCPDDWPECPRVAGADWVALAALEDSPFLVAVEGCSRRLLSSQAVRGMHLMCVLPPPAGESGRVSATLAVWRDMVRREMPSDVVLLPKAVRTTEHMQAAVSRKLRLPPRGARYQQPAFFTTDGRRVVTGRGLLGLLGADGGGDQALMMEGGQWLWPPVEVGYAHSLPDLTAPGVTTRVVTLSFQPLIVEIENFLSPGENQHMIRRAAPHMAKSGVALKDADVGKAAKEFRTSSQYFLPTTNDEVLERIDRRVSMLTRIPISHAEYIQASRPPLTRRSAPLGALSRLRRVLSRLRRVPACA